MAEATNRLTLKDVRIAFAHGIFTARAQNPGDEPKYGASFLFSPDRADIKKAVEAAVIRAAQAKWGDKAAATLKELKAADRLPIHDGNTKATYGGYEGQLFINAGNKLRPTVIDGQRQPIDATDGKVYSGCYGNVMVEIWAQQHPKGGKRVNAALLGFQKTRDGERLAGGSVASADDFELLPNADDSVGDGQAAPESLFE